MILLAGLPDEPPLAMAATALEEIGASFALVDQRRHADIKLSLIPARNGAEVGGHLTLQDGEIDLADVRAVYTRLHGPDSLPELASLAETEPRRARFQRLVQTLTTFADICPGVVLNRSPGMATNNSKGYQAQLIMAAGFRVPRTLITNSPDRARHFIEECWASGKDVIFKSASAVRSIVRTVDRSDLDRLGRLRICPVQFQERVEGTDMRVHVVGDTVFATEIETTGTDYRYASREPDGRSRLTASELPASVARRCCVLAETIGLTFAGVDLRRTPDGDWVCFEVNPSPAYSYYENHTGQPIALAVATALSESSG